MFQYIFSRSILLTYRKTFKIITSIRRYLEPNQPEMIIYMHVSVIEKTTTSD